MTDGITVLVGSPRPKGTSSSESMARELLARWSEQGVPAELVRVAQVYRPGPTQDRFFARLAESPRLVLVSPIYVNSLPYPVMACLEALAGHAAPGLELSAVFNCGFPEPLHCHLAVRMCDAFCREVGAQWLGSLEVGGGGVINGRPLSEVGRPVEGLRQGLREMADAVAEHRPVPETARAAASRALLEPRLYRWLGSLGWVVEAAKAGSLFRLGAQPYRRALARRQASEV
jgi:hypothetical protein